MRARLVLVALAATSLVALAFLAPLAILVRDLAVDRELSAAERDAESIARLIATLGTEAAVDVVGPGITVGGEVNGRPTTIVLADGSTLGADLDVGEDLSAAAKGATFRQPVLGGEAVYVPVVGASGRTEVVRVVAGAEAMESGVARVWLTLGLLGVVLVGIAVAVADRLGRAVVRPIDELADAAARLGSGDLTTRVSIERPKELQRVGIAFNRLASQITVLLQHERETAADLSHRLRTPLTAARLNVDALPEGDEKERLALQVDEMERVVDHIIYEVRRPDRQARGAQTDAAAVLVDRVAFWDALAGDEGRRLETRIRTSEAMVLLPEPDLVAALDSVIGNVFSHTETGVDLRVSAERNVEGFIDIVVEDAGTGFPESVVERGASEAGSTGLGLDIARRTAYASGGDFFVDDSELGGAKVVLRLGLVDPN